MSKKFKNFSDELSRDPEELVKYLDLALEGANLGIWDWYLKDNTVRFDRRWAEMLGIDYETIPMELNTWESRVHPEDIKKCYADIKNYMDGKTEYYENIHRMKHEDGHWVYILDRGRFSDWDENGNPTRFTGTHFDITSSEQYRKQLSLFFENSPFGYAFCDMEGNLLEINQRYSEITGYSFEELKKLSYWDITPRKYEANEAEQIEMMKNTGRYGPYRKEYLQKNGNLIPVELNGFVLEDYNGVTGIWSTVEDISEKAMLESQLIHSSKLASVGVLAAGVGHEINNPLAIIKAFVEKLERDNPDNKSLLETTQRIDVAIERIAKIVVGLRTFSRFDSVQTEKFNVISTLKESIGVVEDIFSTEGIEIESLLTLSDSFEIIGNMGQMHQVFLNLLANSKDATENQKNRKVTISCERKGDSIFLSIKDNGSGISEEEINRIFDPFFTTKGVNQGTGIGLSIVHNIISDHKGEISVKSRPNEGATFTIRLPLAKMNPEGSLLPIRDPDKKLSEPARDGLVGSVMLVDDEEEFRELLSESIERMGLRVTCFKNGQEAFNAYSKNPDEYDLIISDMKMPILDGPGLLRKVSDFPSDVKPKFVVISGGVNVDLEKINAKFTNLKIDGYIYKPFSDSDIHEVLKNVLSMDQKSKKKAA